MFNMQDLLYMHAREKRLHTPSIETLGVFILNDPAPLLFCVSLSSTLAQSWEYNKHVNAWREDGQTDMASFSQNFSIREAEIPYRSREFRYLFLYQNAQLKHALITKLHGNANKST